MDRHRAAVRLLSSTIKSLHAQGQPYRISHGSTNSTRPPHLKASAAQVDISVLSHVLAIDPVSCTALVEPNVPMDALVSQTLRHGLVPPVVMEFPGITAGGGFAGTAGESSSFRYGFFDKTVRKVEMVLPDGNVVEALNPAPSLGGSGDGGSSGRSSAKVGKENYHDLFQGAAGAVGTLGITTLLELNLVRAQRFVRTTYRRTRSMQESMSVLREETAKAENDYVDGILYSQNHGVIVSGTMTDESPTCATFATQQTTPIRTFSAPNDPWFYMHVRDLTSPTNPSSPITELIPLAEYLFRYDRGGFWVGSAAFDYFSPLVPNTRPTRYLLDDFLHTRMLYRALHASGESARFLVQDVAVPYSSAAQLVDWVSSELKVWPLWLCPLKTPSAPTFHPHLRDPDQAGQEGEMLNVGIWGWGPSDPQAFIVANRALEARVAQLGGTKWLYAHAYYTREEFWDIYGSKGDGGRWYEGLRRKFNAVPDSDGEERKSLPSVYDKVSVRAAARAQEGGEMPGEGWMAKLKKIWPVPGLVGIMASIRSGDHALHRHAEWKWEGRGPVDEDRDGDGGGVVGDKAKTA